MRTSSRFTLMTISSLLLLFVVGLTLRGFGSMPTHAASTKASITLSLTLGPPTTSVLVSGKGFKGRETVTLTFDSTQIKSVKASKTGGFSATITVPSSAQPGNHFVQGRGSSSGFFAQATLLVQTDWVQQGFNREHTGFNVFENVLNTTNVSNLTQDWTMLTGLPIDSVPSVANGIVYVGSNDSNLYAFNAATGAKVWSYTTGSAIYSSPAIANGMVYFGSSNGKLYALNATTGTLVWSYTTGKTIYSSPLTANGIVYVGSENHKLYAFNAISGTLLWTYTSADTVSYSPAIENGVIYMSSGTQLYALNSASGALLWRYIAGDYIGYSSPATANGDIYVGSGGANGGTLYALNASTGALLWTAHLEGAITYSPAVANGVVYIENGAFNASTGALLWGYSAGSYWFDSPTVANGVVYGFSGNGELNALNANTGALLWNVSNNFYYSAPVVANGVVYAGSNNGDLDAFHLPGTTP